MVENTMKVSVLGPLPIVAGVLGQHSLLLTCALLVVCAAVAVLSASSKWSPSIRAVLVVAVVARLLVVVLARHHTPDDVAVISVGPVNSFGLVRTPLLRFRDTSGTFCRLCLMSTRSSRRPGSPGGSLARYAQLPRTWV